MTESKSNAFDVFSADINTAHDLNVRPLRYTLLAMTEPEFNQSVWYQFGFEVCATESPHGVPWQNHTFAANWYRKAAEHVPDLGGARITRSMTSPVPYRPAISRVDVAHTPLLIAS
jgi:hypothetical protein